MTKTNDSHADVKDESKDQLAADFETLKDSFAQLRDDVTTLVNNAVGTSRSGAVMVRNATSTAALDVKNCGKESFEQFERKISERPLMSAAIALGIGVILGKLFSNKR